MFDSQRESGRQGSRKGGREEGRERRKEPDANITGKGLERKQGLSTNLETRSLYICSMSVPLERQKGIRKI